MKAIILYESFFGNTAAIAKAMGNVDIEVGTFYEISWAQISKANLLIVGSPTRSFRPCENTVHFLKSIPNKGLKGIKVAAFDTRISLESIKSKSLRFILKTGGYAAKHIAKTLEKKGGDLIAPPEGFLVSDEKGPLVDGEIERATKWAKKLLSSG